MVPFPYSEVSEGKEHDAYLAAEALSTKPDGRGLLLPPVKKESVIGIRSIWDKIDSPATQDAVGDMYDSVPYGILRHYIKTWLQLKHRSEAGNVIFHAAVRHNAEKREGIYGALYLHDWEDLDPKKALEDAKQAILTHYAFRDVPSEKKKQMIRELEILLPHAIETADLIGKYAKYVHTNIYWNDKRKKWQLTARLFMNHISRGTTDPRMEVYQLFGPEAIKKIHKMHRIIYELTKPVSRVVFERPSGVEEFLDEREKEEVEREVQELLKKLQEPETVPQRQEVQKPKPVQTRTKETPQRAPTPPVKRNPLEVRKEKDVVRIEDVDPQKAEVHPETGLPIIRNGEQIVVLPPHKHPKEIPNLYPEAVPPYAIHMFYALINEGITDPHKLKEGIQKARELLKEYREELQKSKDVRTAADKILSKIREERDKTDQKHIQEALNILSSSIRRQKFYVMFHVPDYTTDHAIIDIAGSEVQLAEAEKLVEDMVKNPEKYGIDWNKEEATKKMYELMEKHFRRPGYKVVGFTHVKRTRDRV